GPETRHLYVDLFERLFGLGEVPGRQHELTIEFVEIGEQVVDRPRSRRAVDDDLIGLEISLDRGSGDFRRRIAGFALRLHRQIDRLPAARPQSAGRRLQRALFGLRDRGVALGRRLRTLARQRGFVANRFENRKDRRGRRRSSAQLEVFRLVVEQRLQLEIVERGGPGGDEILAVELEDAGEEAHVLLLDGALFAGRAEHPVLLLQLVGDRLHVAEEGDREPVVGEEAGYAD